MTATYYDYADMAGAIVVFSSLGIDDADVSHWPYVQSKTAQGRMHDMARQRGLYFTHNPGGAEFNWQGGSDLPVGFRCQVGDCDDVRDWLTLRDAIRVALPGTEDVA